LDTIQTGYIAEFARSQGWKVIGIFVGDTAAAGYQEIRRISSIQQNAETLRVDTFDDLQYRVTSLAQSAVVASAPYAG